MDLNLAVLPEATSLHKNSAPPRVVATRCAR